MDVLEKRMEEACTGFEREAVLTADGTALRVYRYGPVDAQSVVLVNPIGVPILISSRLMRRLGERYRVTCWEQRGCRSEWTQYSARPHDYATYMADLARILELSGKSPHALIGICSGAALAVKAAAEHLVAPRTLVLVSPAVFFESGYVRSLFDQAVVPYMQAISLGKTGIANEILEMRAAQQRAACDSPTDEMLIEAADKWGLRCRDSLLVYARTLHVFTQQRMDADLARVRQQVFVLSAADDQTVAIQSVRRLAQLLPRAVLTEYAKGGHFTVYLNATVQAAICGLVQAGDVRAVPDVA